VARDAEIDVALPDEGGYVGGGKEDTGMFGLSVQILIFIVMRVWEQQHTVPCGGSALGRRRVDLDG